jgi:hypothetical protein
MDYTKYRVGTLTVREPREVTQYYECAAWHKTVRCPAGTYAVYAYLNWCNVKEGNLGSTLYAPFDGVVTSACFVNRIGSHYGSDRGPEMVGHSDNGSVKIPNYAIDDHVQSGDLVLNPALVVAQEYDSLRADGGKYTFYRLNRESESLRDDLRYAARAA